MAVGYHLMRWAQATGEVGIVKCLGLNNPADIATKYNSADLHHHIDSMMCRGSKLPPRLQGEFSTRVSLKKPPNQKGAQLWEAKITQRGEDEVLQQVLSKH